jgi:hypothetical protein
MREIGEQAVCDGLRGIRRIVRDLGEVFPIRRGSRTRMFRIHFPESKSKECEVKLNSKTTVTDPFENRYLQYVPKLVQPPTLFECKGH